MALRNVLIHLSKVYMCYTDGEDNGKEKRGLRLKWLHRIQMKYLHRDAKKKKEMGNQRGVAVDEKIL